MKIGWEKWVDPLLVPEQYDYKIEQSKYKDSGPLKTLNELKEEQRKKRRQVVMSPYYGVIPIEEHNSPCCQFNFWIGHTDFDLNQQRVDRLTQVAGIESLNVITPYRFRVGFGKMFNETEVKRDIECTVAVPEQLFCARFNIKELPKTIKPTKKHWSLLVTPEGKNNLIEFDYIDDTNIEQFKNHNDVFGMFNGNFSLYTSWFGDKI